MISRTDFENHLSDYVREELPPAQLGDMEEYLAAHPEALEEVAELRTVLELTGAVRDSCCVARPAACGVERCMASSVWAGDRSVPSVPLVWNAGTGRSWCIGGRKGSPWWGG